MAKSGAEGRSLAFSGHGHCFGDHRDRARHPGRSGAGAGATGPRETALRRADRRADGHARGDHRPLAAAALRKMVRF